MALFKFRKEAKQEAQEPAPASYGPPVDRVRIMRQSGLTNNQIIQQLQREGFKPSQIYDAMSQADLATTEPEQFGQPTQGQQEAVQPEAPMNAEYAQEWESPEGPASPERFEELAEAIIDEKWAELMKDINKIIEWKGRMDAKISAIDQKIDDLSENFRELQKGVLQKVGEYDKNIVNVGTDVKAMEKVFQKLLPSLTDNINELSRITKKVKEKK